MRRHSEIACYHSQHRAVLVLQQLLSASVGTLDRVAAGRHLPSRLYHDTFNIHLQWLLTGKLHTRLRPEPLANDDNAAKLPPYALRAQQQQALNDELLSNVDLIRLDHYLLDTDFRDTVGDAITQCTAELLSIERGFPLLDGATFLDEVPNDSPTRKLVVELAAWTADNVSIKVLCMLGRGENLVFKLNLLQALSSRFLSLVSTSPFDGCKTSCEYHCHGSKKLCYREKLKRYCSPFLDDWLLT